MRKILLAMLAVGSVGIMNAQDCSELIISEYVEGTGNDKGIEFYNPTANDIDLGPYVLQRFSNGDNSATDETDLQGTIPAYGTWVLVNGQTEDVEIGGGSISPAVNPIMQAYANQLDGGYPAPTYMNGNDALVLVKTVNGTEAVIDIFGKPGEDPGVAWTDDEAGGYVTTDEGTFLSANHALRRKASVKAGVTLPPPVFNALLEYDSLEINTWNGLGLHCNECDPSYTQDCLGFIDNIEEFDISTDLKVFPNPTSGTLNVVVKGAIAKIEIYSTIGQLVLTDEDFYGDIDNATIDASEMENGQYLVNIHLKSGLIVSKPFMKR